MFTIKPTEKSELEKARDDALVVLAGLHPTDNKYADALKAVETLSNLMNQESREKLNVNTAISVFGTLLSVGMIVGHERAHVVTSKALAFLPKLLR